jgi:potassium/hydrogen antiporter
VNASYLVLALAGALVCLGLVAGLYSARFGLSHLLVFLLVGMAAGIDGPLGLPFAEYKLAFAVGNVALAIILLDGGLRTPVKTLRRAAVPALLLATVGVLITTAVVAVLAAWWLGLPPLLAALLGAIVSSTDAAAVFSQLSRSGTRLPERLGATIEVESGMNDPLAVFLTLTLIGLIVPASADHSLLALAARQLGIGLAFGLGGGWLVAALLRRLPLGQDHDGMTALLLAASGITVFGLTAMLDGSGLLAVYLFGILVAHRAPLRVKPALAALNGYTWLSEATMFLLLGLLVTPHEVARLAWPGLAIAAALMFLARPVAVVLCLTPLRFPWRHQVLVSWVGLRGAVPIVLALYPVLAGVDQAYRLFDLAFVVVLCSLLLQATTAAPLARWLGLSLPPPPDAPPRD